MSENKHAPEPYAYMTQESQWRLGNGVNGKGAVPIHKHKSSTAKIPLYEQSAIDGLTKQRDELQEEVNALKEIAKYDLAEFARTLDVSYDEINLLKKQRDELLAFSEEVRRSGDTRIASMAIAAIARVKGGA